MLKPIDEFTRRRILKEWNRSTRETRANWILSLTNEELIEVVSIVMSEQLISESVEMLLFETLTRLGDKDA